MKIDKLLLKRIIYLMGITLGVYLIFKYLLPLVIPFLLAAVLAGFLYPIAIYIKKKIKIPYKIGSIILVLLFVSIITVVLGVIIYYIFIQAKSLAVNYPFIKARVIDEATRICYCCDEWLGIKGGKIYSIIISVSEYVGDNWSDKIMPVITQRIWGVCLGTGKMMIIILFIFIATALIMEDYKNVLSDYKNSFIVKRFTPVIECLRSTMWAYIKTQFIIAAIITVVCAAGLFLIGNPYALLIGILIAVVDALPILGSGSILVPWGIVYILMQDYTKAAIVVTVYVICLIAREVLEPKIMGQKTGLRPIYTFISFYIGIELFGIAGIILGPIGMVAIQSIYMSACADNYTHDNAEITDE